MTTSKVSVVLDAETHRAAKIAAMDAGRSLSTWIAELVAKELGRLAKRKSAA